MPINNAMRILVVDDYETTRRIIKNLLKQLGFEQVDEAAAGEEALRQLEKNRYGVVISDWNLGAMTGLELLGHIRAHASWKTLPFILVTADSKPENGLIDKEAGISTYIVKPFNADTLKSKLISLLGEF